MDRRSCKRIKVNFRATFTYDDVMYTGTVRNLSVNGMYIKMDMGLYYYKPKFHVQLMLKNKLLTIPVELSRFEEVDGCYFAMGVELKNPPQKYLDFVESLDSSQQVACSELQH